MVLLSAFLACLLHFVHADQVPDGSNLMQMAKQSPSTSSETTNAPWDFHPDVHFSNVSQNGTVPPGYQTDCAHCHSVCCNAALSNLATAVDCGCLAACGPCNFCQKPWVVTPLHFETPAMGNFNVSIQVPPLPGLQQYTIDEVQVTITSMGIDTSSWKIDLIGPGLGDVTLKEYTVNGGDLDFTFSDTPCVGCVLPFRALSAFKGKSALGNWTLAIKASNSSRHGFVSWVSLSLKMNCVYWDFHPDVHFSNVTQNTTYGNTPANVTFNNTPPARYQMDCAHCQDACCNAPMSKLATAAECGCLATCGPCNFCRKPWVVTPQHFEIPAMGNFNVSIHVPPLPGLQQYIINQVQVTITSMGMDTSSWKIDLIGPGLGDVILKQITVNGGDLDGTFSDTPCVGCVLPFQALSAFEGKSALGNWTLAIKAAESSRIGFVSWVSLSLRMNCVNWDFHPEVHFSNVTQNTTYGNTPANVTFNNTPPARYQMDCAHCQDACCNAPMSKLATAAECGCLATCGPCNFCQKPWVVTPQHFELPAMGNFNVSIQVPPLPGLQQYTIDEVQVTITSMGLDTSSWKIDLIGPGSGDVILKHITVNGGDLDGTFSDTPCVGCVLPFQALSAFKGKSALGNWTLSIKAADRSRHGFVSWVSLSLRMNC